MPVLVLSALAVLLSGPVPALLARWTVLRRAPRAAMVLWQAVALAAVLSALGATLALVTTALPADELRWYDVMVAVVGLTTTAVVAGRLLLTGHLVGTRLRAVRRRHRELLALTAEEDEGVLVVEGGAPMAWCVPGLARGRVVISRGAVDQLADEERAAVVAHERAHLDARHDLVLEAFTVLHQAFPRWVSSAQALREVRLLTEVLADQAAVRRHGTLTLARALVALTERDPVPSLAPVHEEAKVALAANQGSQLLIRVGLLEDDRSRRLLGAGLLALAAAVLVLPTVVVVVPWLSSVASST